MIRKTVVRLELCKFMGIVSMAIENCAKGPGRGADVRKKEPNAGCRQRARDQKYRKAEVIFLTRAHYRVLIQTHSKEEDKKRSQRGLCLRSHSGRSGRFS